MTTATPHPVLEFLTASCHHIRQCESDAKQALDAGKVDEYRAIMLEKARYLSKLPHAGEASVATLPLPLREEVAGQLRSFGASAMNALSVNSVFYMSALLFPDDYVEGSPNNLEIFTENIRTRLA